MVLDAQRQKSAHDERILTLDVQMCAGCCKTAENKDLAHKTKTFLKNQIQILFPKQFLKPKGTMTQQEGSQGSQPLQRKHRYQGHVDSKTTDMLTSGAQGTDKKMRAGIGAQSGGGREQRGHASTGRQALPGLGRDREGLREERWCPRGVRGLRGEMR